MFPPSVCDAERLRRALQNPVEMMNLVATHWLECALAYHPEHHVEIDALSLRLEEATGDIERRTDGQDSAWSFAQVETVPEQVIALEEIVAVLRVASKLMRDPSDQAIIHSVDGWEDRAV